MFRVPSVSGLFKWRQFEPEVILLAVGWYLRFSLSYRDVEELLAEPSNSSIFAVLKLASSLPLATTVRTMGATSSGRRDVPRPLRNCTTDEGRKDPSAGWQERVPNRLRRRCQKATAPSSID